MWFYVVLNYITIYLVGISTAEQAPAPAEDAVKPVAEKEDVAPVVEKKDEAPVEEDKSAEKNGNYNFTFYFEPVFSNTVMSIL